jgi:alginate O-acetyltransferase complex protein AlgI
MLFPTVTFAIFFVAVFSAYWLARARPRIWKPVLLAASGVFYAWWDWRFVFLLAGSIVLNHLFAGAMGRWGPRPWLAAGVVANLAVLAFFKYYDFFLTSLFQLFLTLGWDTRPPLLALLVPIGISFFTFEAISYLIELKRGLVSRMSLLDLATYMSFFPKLTSGPITRPSEFAPQLEMPGQAELEGSTALWLIARGLFKKVVLASYLADAVTAGVFAAPGQYSGPEVLIGIYAYTVQIYLDFSAYTDMAIGLALLLGFRLPENFDHPYARLTVTTFWGHWHMSLTRWIRDFVFTPLILRGNRSTASTVRNLFLVMLLLGIWHGAGWTFVVFGVIHGVALAVERLHRVSRRSSGRAPLSPHPVARVIRWVVTFHVVALGWVFFGADSIASSMEILGRVIAPGPGQGVSPLVPIVVLAILAVQFAPADITGRLRSVFTSLRPVFQAVFLGVVLLVVDTLGPAGVPPFIYFRF